MLYDNFVIFCNKIFAGHNPRYYTGNKLEVFYGNGLWSATTAIIILSLNWKCNESCETANVKSFYLIGSKLKIRSWTVSDVTKTILARPRLRPRH